MPKSRKFMTGLVGLALIGGISAPLVNSYLENAGSGHFANFLTILPDSFKQRKESVSPEALGQYKICVTLQREAGDGMIEADSKCDYLKRR